MNIIDGEMVIMRFEITNCLNDQLNLSHSIQYRHQYYLTLSFLLLTAKTT